MEQEYLPGDTPQQRLQDLMKEYKITQAELASKIGVTESSISRFLNGTKNKLTIEQIISIARIFNVSSDFLLCLTNVPDKKNYDISELGLSAEAARNLYTGRVNPEVVGIKCWTSGSRNIRVKHLRLIPLLTSKILWVLSMRRFA